MYPDYTEEDELENEEDSIYELKNASLFIDSENERTRRFT
jgi:hypothetical protein